MAKKKAATAQSRGPGIPGIIWFSRRLPFLRKNKGLTVAEKKKKAEKDCKELLDESPNATKWKISGFKWKSPDKTSGKYKLTVYILRKSTGGGNPPPGDPPVKAERQPPPSM